MHTENRWILKTLYHACVRKITKNPLFLAGFCTSSDIAELCFGGAEEDRTD